MSGETRPLNVSNLVGWLIDSDPERPPLSALFPDVVNCMQTDNLELKKLVYLYLMNYAKSQPDMAIMAVNTFVKVCKGVGQALHHTCQTQGSGATCGPL